MNTIQNKKEFDYTNIQREDMRYFGIHKISNRLHIDTQRYKQVLENDRVTEFLPNSLCSLQLNSFFIPAHQFRHDYKFNLFRDLIGELKKTWIEEYKPLFKYIKTPDQVYETNRLEQMMYTSCSDDFDEIESDAMFAALRRAPQYTHVTQSLYCSFISKIATEIDRITLIVMTQLGYKSNDYSFNSFKKFSDGLQKNKEGVEISKLKKYNAYNLLHKLNNFLKHNTLSSYNDLKKWYPNNVASVEKGTANIEYENGMFAGDWIIIEENYIDNLLDKLILFFKDYCKEYLKENIEEADWNYDEYFIKVYHEILDLRNYFGV